MTKFTLPVGVDVLVTVAVKVTELPYVDGLAEDPTVVLVATAAVSPTTKSPKAVRPVACTDVLVFAPTVRRLQEPAFFSATIKLAVFAPASTKPLVKLKVAA